MPPDENQLEPDLQKNPGSPPKGPAEPPPQTNTPLPGVPANPPAPPGPASQYDFILRDPQAPTGKFGALNASKPIFIGVIGGGLVLLLLLVFVLFSGSNNNYSQVVSLAAKNQEILRVNQAYARSFTDTDNYNLEVTTTATLTSEQAQILGYLRKVKYKFKAKELNSAKNTQTDATLQAAIGSNNFDSAYITYLNTALLQYQAALQGTYKTSTKNFQKILSTSFDNNKVLLASPQFKQSQ